VKAIDTLKEKYLTESELAGFLNVDTKRIRDLRSHHMNGKHKFIECIKPTSKCILYRLDDVIEYLEGLCSCNSFGIVHEDPDK